MIRFVGNRQTLDLTNADADDQQRLVCESEDALLAWLTWDDQYQQITEMIFDGEHDPAVVEEMLDCCDYAREKAGDYTYRLWTVY